MDKKLILKIDAQHDGKTVGYILEKCMGISGALIIGLKKEEDGIVLDGERVFVTKKVQAGSVLCAFIKDKPSQIPPKEYPLDILFEDEDIIVINKPRRMPTHPSRNHYEDTLANALMHYYRGMPFTFRAITRLDTDTSGVVLVAKNPFSGAILSESMKEGKIKKEYAALVCGVPVKEKGRIEAPIKRLQESIITRGVSPDGKEAITEYETILSSGNVSLLKLNPITGRTHQLRVHLSYIGTPIYGDSLYGNAKKGEATLLHCKSICFSHPFSKKEIVIDAPVPEDMENIIKKEDM